MASPKAVVQWYQTDRCVTASVSIKEISADERKLITSKFEAQRCAIHVGEEVYWETSLANSIVPENCSIQIGRVRAELKMKKADPVKWTDFEATGDAAIRSPSTDRVSKKTPDAVTSSPTTNRVPNKTPQCVPSPSPPSPPSSSPSTAPHKTVNRKSFSKTVQNDFVYLNHLRHEWMNRGEGEVCVKVMVSDVIKETCTVDFKGKQFELLFQTEDAKFLSSYTGSSQTMFVWKAQLFDAIKPDASHFQVSPTAITIVLRKTSTVEWKSLERSQHQMSLSSNSNDDASGIHSSPEKETRTITKTVRNDFVYLNHLRHDWMDRGEGEVCVKVMVSDVIKETCTVDFKGKQFELLFRTEDAKFLSSYTGSSQTMFVWKVQLFDAIKPDASHFQVSPTAITIVLRKTSTVKWKSLERSQHQMSLSSNSNDDDSGIHSSPPKKTSSDESSDFNDLDAIDDVTATPPSLPAQTNVSVATAPPIHTKSDASYPSSGRDGNKYTPTSSSASSEPVQNFHTSPIYTSPVANTNSDHTHNPTKRPPTNPSHIFPSELETSDPSYRYEQLRRPSTTGLTNLGNTCFMNSILQCLSNTPELRDYFVSGRYLANINSENRLGFEGKLAKCFCVILRKLWSGEYDYFSPKNLLEIVARRSKHFDGHSQHDTHEFMSYLIDGLHEDLNRVREKPITKPIEMENHPDREVAAETWRVYKTRNDSMMVDLFQGQFKSTLVCQECNKESVTFDPFMSLSVPIPRNLRRLAVTFVPQDPYTTPKQLILQLPPEATLKLLKASVARRTSLSMAQLRVFEVYKCKFQSFMADNRQPISGIKSSDIIIVSEVLSEKKAGDEVVEINVVQRGQVAPFPTKCALCGCGSEEGRKLQRCGKCKAIGYCHRACQEQDWAEHRLKCGKVKTFPVGLPFVISLPASQLTFSKLTEYAEQFSSRSVTVTRRSSKQLPCSRQTSVGSDENIQESAEDIQTSDGSMQECTENIQTSEANVEECTDDIQTSNESIQECAEDIQESPMYTLTRVDRYVEPISGESPLKARGDEPLEFDDTTIYLAMDWRNGPNEKDGVDITPRDTMECVEDGKEESISSQSDTVSLTDCLQLFTEPETLSQDEAWYCPRCKEHRPAIKQMSVWRLPQILIIHLKRFSFHNLVWRSKIDHLVTFPLSGLDMSPYLLGDAAKDVSPETPPIYDLYATVNHYGNIYIGHYVANVKPPPSEENRNNEWVCYDDHKMWMVEEDKITCSEAYVLFYRRRDATCTENNMK